MNLLGIQIHLTSNETKALAQEISAVKAESKSFQDEKESTEKKYRYDVRILNVLATTGQKASSIAHELKNDRNSVSVNYQAFFTSSSIADSLLVKFWTPKSSAIVLSSTIYLSRSIKNRSISYTSFYYII